MINTESFVLYESVYKQFKRLYDRGRTEDATEFINAIMEYGLYGVIPEEDSDVWLFGFEQSITSIGAAKDRYTAAVENGKKGGRPKKVDENKIIELKAQGLTNAQVAAQLNCSVSSIEKANSKIRKNQKNLNDNVNVNENNNEKENKKEKLSLVGDLEMEMEKVLRALSKEEKEFYDFEYECFIEEGMTKQEAQAAALAAVGDFA